MSLFRRGAEQRLGDNGREQRAPASAPLSGRAIEWAPGWFFRANFRFATRVRISFSFAETFLRRLAVDLLLFVVWSCYAYNTDP